MADFASTIAQSYATEGAVLELGRGVHEGKLEPEAVVRVPLAMLNRHGLVAGATGTGKTKTLQLLAEQLSAAGVPVFAADVKGDVSGLAAAGEKGGPAEKRMADLGMPFEPSAFPVEFLSLGGIGPGVPLRATVSDFGSRLLAKILFFDEAHLLFDGATKALLESVEQTVRLIRSKGVGVFFVTQVPDDIPASILAQLGNRVQHALRAFTPDDAKALKAAVSTYPKSDFYDMAQLLTSVGTGEAAVTILSETGVPTPVVHTRMVAPRSRLAPADDVDGPAKASPLWAKYGTRAENESAREKLAARMEAPAPPDDAPPPQAEHKERAKAAGGGAGAIGDFLTSRQGKALQRQVLRGVFGMLKKRR